MRRTSLNIYIVLRSLDLITCTFTNPEVFSEWLIKSIVCKFSELIQILNLGGIIVHVLLPIAFKLVLISNCVSVIPVLYIKLNTDWHLFISEDTVRILQLPFHLFFLKKPCNRKRSDLETLHQPMSPQTKKVGARPPTHPSPFWKAYKWTQENNNFFLLCT